MPVRHIYLKIESIPDYSPVCPDPMFAPPVHYGRDCMRNIGHEDGTIPTSEINARTVSVLVYREYLLMRRGVRKSGADMGNSGLPWYGLQTVGAARTKLFLRTGR